MNPSTTPPHPTHPNHDGPDGTAAILYKRPQQHQQHHHQTHEPAQRHQTWAEIASGKHPNPQHIPFSTGRGASSARRYRIRTTRRKLLTPNPLFHRLSLTRTGTEDYISKTYKHTTRTLEKIHNKHSNILLPRRTHHDEIPQEINTIDDQINETIIEFNALSTEFDDIATRLSKILDDKPTDDDHTT